MIDDLELLRLIENNARLSSEEIAVMKKAGALPVTLGPRILRTETAGMATIAALMCLYGEMEGIP